MRILVTGSSGFVGSAVTRIARARGDEVVALDLRGEAWREELAATDAELCLHLAWPARGDYLSSDDNLTLVAKTAELLRALPTTTRLVAAGTCYEQEWAPPTLYGACKRAAREMVEAHRDDAAWVQLYYLYGPGEADGRLVPTVARALLEGRAAELSEGRQERDFVYVDDVARALLAAPPGRHQLGTGDPVTPRAIAEHLADAVGRRDLLQFGAPAGGPARIAADPTSLRDAGWTPEVSLEDGLRRCLAYWRERT